eukprot:6345220-Prymnesium_polylepis.1
MTPTFPSGVSFRPFRFLSAPTPLSASVIDLQVPDALRHLLVLDLPPPCARAGGRAGRLNCTLEVRTLDTQLHGTGFTSVE